MGMNGNLKDIAIAEIIQLNCLDRKTAKLQAESPKGQVEIYFKDGEIVHAKLGELTGEEVIYQVLDWKEGSFSLENEASTTKNSVNRSWSGLLLEGARRIDESNTGTDSEKKEQLNGSEGNKMTQKFDEILAGLADEVTGYIASALVGIDGINLAVNEKMKLDLDLINSQMTMLLKLVKNSTEKIGAGALEDNLLTTENAFILMRFLPGNQFFLILSAERKSGNLGNMRLLSKMYTERLMKAMPRA